MDAVRAALAAGGNVKERDRANWTPLMHAALECRADIDDAGRIAIDYADSNDAAMISTLKQFGSQPATRHSGRAACDREKTINFPIIDCTAGPRTVTTFQQQRNLQQTGVLDTPTLQALGIKP